MSGWVSFFFTRQWLVYSAAILLRLALLVYGRWQDSNSPVKYTDIDYLVFTDAARYVSIGRSPYDRATYRYTPLLAWLLYPTTWGGPWFEFGKCLFAFGDILTGFLIARFLREQAGFSKDKAMKYASIWLLNPMVANISTRGSSEGLVVAMVVPILLQALRGRIWICGFLLGVAVHVKIYPFIYAAAVFWWLGPKAGGSFKKTESDSSHFSLEKTVLELVNKRRQSLVIASALAFTLLNGVMFYAYGMPFIKHTYLYHFTRLDHRHNFSVYNTVLHLNSAYPSQASDLRVESLAFIPQLLLAIVAIPLLCAKKDLAGTMLAQTFAFVTFNKVCTSQYFLWYMVFLPFYLPYSSFMSRPKLGVSALVLWILGQAAWLQQGFELEFLAQSTFVPGLWLASASFYLINCWILGVIVADVAAHVPQ
ncbi:glycosyltransferase family 50 protein [Hortaea werneckii]|nr:glycosyltransferase family 50 protein [Hortaea werneckii]KAI6990571.1 glycosyltransferase family 50 protein [Hortaea werneckii]KAI7143717.1 glycosyltransferase family 50 protein [Hortaea werneckii]KAI7171425.1 glycosyltransferase family 50 protein [Hortaea werneckii]